MWGSPPGRGRAAAALALLGVLGLVPWLAALGLAGGGELGTDRAGPAWSPAFGESSFECSCEPDAVRLLPAEGMLAGCLALGAGLLGLGAHAGRSSIRKALLAGAGGALSLAALVGALLPSQVPEPGPWPASGEGGLATVLAIDADWSSRTLLHQQPWFHSRTARRALQGVDFRVRDVTDVDDPGVREFQLAHELHGVPAVLFFDAVGREMRELRIYGPVGREEFAERVLCAKALARRQPGLRPADTRVE